MTDRSLLVSATEISGDARGARLASELLRLVPGLRIVGLGGARMRDAGVDVRLDITDRGTVGWFDHWPDLPCYLSALRTWRHQIRHHRPTAVMVIDAPGISFPFARAARAAGVPVIYFVTPQTWLWNPAGAVDRLRASADVVIPTLQAEAALYERARLPVVYEGHPALDDLVALYGDGGLQGRNGRDSAITIGLVPGSRRHAVRRLLPIMLDALDLIRQRVEVHETIVSVAAPALRAAVEACLRGRPSRGVHVVDDLHVVLRASDVAIASTGGNLLDAAFAGVPVVACYRVDRLTYLGAKHLLHLDTRIPTYTLPDLLAGGGVVPALIQENVTPGRLADAVVSLVTDHRGRDTMLEGYKAVRAAMGEPGVNGRIAERIIRLVDPGCPAPPLDPGSLRLRSGTPSNVEGSGRPERGRRAPTPQP